jgi:N-acetylglucosamine-6-phosphate deacetylase
MNAGELHAVVADHVFDGTTRHQHAAVLIGGARVSRIVSRSEIPENLPVRILPDGVWLVPGFIDLQVNGGGDVLFNDAPTPEGISVIAAAHRKFGTTGFLPTLITDTPEKMHAAMAAVQSAMRTEPTVLGLHLEGPFLSPERAGIHDRKLFRQPTSEDVEMLTRARNGALLVTLAPEQLPAGFIESLSDAGVCVSFGLIVEGIHVDPAMLRLALRGVGRPMLVTDAMPPVGGVHSSFTLYGEKIVVRDGRCVRDDGTLAGAYLDMATAMRNCVRLLGLGLEQALTWASSHPARFINLDSERGALAPGHRADMVALDPEKIEVLETWVAGVSQHAA